MITISFGLTGEIGGMGIFNMSINKISRSKLELVICTIHDHLVYKFKTSENNLSGINIVLDALFHLYNIGGSKLLLNENIVESPLLVNSMLKDYFTDTTDLHIGFVSNEVQNEGNSPFVFYDGDKKIFSIKMSEEGSLQILEEMLTNMGVLV